MNMQKASKAKSSMKRSVPALSHGMGRDSEMDAAQLPALPANTTGPYLPNAHNHCVSSRADSHALGLNVQFHHSLAAVGEKEST